MKLYSKLYTRLTLVILIIYHIICFFIYNYYPSKVTLHSILVSLVLMVAIIYSNKTFFSDRKSINKSLFLNKKIILQSFVAIVIVLVFLTLWTYITIKFNPKAEIRLQSSFEFYKKNLWHLPFLCIILPILEELLFRGVFCQNHRSNSRAIQVSSFLFYIIHINLLSSSFIPGLNVLILGAFFGYLFLKTNSLIPSIMAHMVSNILHVFLIPIFTYLAVI